jgi:hypothetical protein
MAIRTEITLDLLRQIGFDLDARKELRVTGDKIWPSAGRLFHALGDSEGVMASGETTGQTGTERPAAGSWQGATGDRTARSRSDGRFSPILSELADWSADRREDIARAIDEYGLMVSVAPPGVWLKGVIRPLEGLDVGAMLLIGLPTDRALRVESWAWWYPDGSPIGPRHTNYPHASICAFEPTDADAWNRERPLVNLIDMYAVWVVRHAYLRRFGRWPGEQIFHTAYERLHEGRKDELCGGCSSGRLYRNCYRPKDLRRASAEVENEFLQRFRGVKRVAPPSPEEAIRRGAGLWK